MTALTDFLLARIAEDEVGLCHCCDQGLDSRIGFARAELEAKRRIVKRYSESSRDVWLDGVWYAHHPTLRDLALPYSNHDDYREEWRP